MLFVAFREKSTHRINMMIRINMPFVQALSGLESPISTVSPNKLR